MRYVREFNTDTLSLISAFENITKTEVRDCINSEDSIYFLVNTGKMGIAIGKNGQNIRAAENILKKQIKIFEWSDQEKDFIKNMIPQSQKISINNTGQAQVSINAKDRGAVFGKGGSNIKVIREFLERNTTVKELKVV